MIINEVENDVFNIYLERHWTYTVDEIDGWKSYTMISHLEYDLHSGVMSLRVFNRTINFWDDTIEQRYEEIVLEKSEFFTSSVSSDPSDTTDSSDLISDTTDSSDLIIDVKLLVLPSAMLLIQRRKKE